MFDMTTHAIDQDLALLDEVVDRIRRSSSAAPVDAAAACLRASDQLTSVAVSSLGRGGFDIGNGLSDEQLLRLIARRTGPDARMLTRAASVLATMPAAREAFAEGSLSWSQVRAIVCAAERLEVSARAALDRLIASRVCDTADPDELITMVDDEVARLREDLIERREDRMIERNFLAIQGRLDGGGTIYGEGDAESIAIMTEALDAVADRPVNADNDDAPSRASQRFDALIGLCQTSLSGGGHAKPRVLVTVDITEMSGGGRMEAARILWSLAGRPARLSAVGTEALLCDATVIPVVFEHGRPIAVGDPSAPVHPKVRAALEARDGGCRFPGCGAPVAWADAHHISERLNGGTSEADNMILLCRRCHRRVHRFGWKITSSPDGEFKFRHRGRTFTSGSRARRRE